MKAKELVPAVAIVTVAASALSMLVVPSSDSATEPKAERAPAGGASDSEPIAPVPRLKLPAQAETAIAIDVTRSATTIAATHHDSRFDVAGMTITPRDGAGKSRQEGSLHYRLAEVSRGGQAELIDTTVAPVVSGSSVSYQRSGSLEETYLALAGGLEQLFVFRELPNRPGDLIVRGEVVTDLEPANGAGGGVSLLLDGQTIISVSRALAIDACGSKTEVALSCDEGSLTLRVPGEWLESAVAPVVIDPLISSALQLTESSTSERSVDMTYNARRDEFLLAYVSGTETIAVQRLDGDGNVLFDAVIVDETATTKVSPVVVWSETAEDVYLVAYERDEEIWVSVLDGALNTVSAPARIYDPSGTTEVQQSAAADYDPSRDQWVVLWSDTSGSASQDILMNTVTTDGTIGTEAVVRDVASALLTPAVSYAPDEDKFLCAFREGSNIQGVVLDGTLSTNSSPVIAAGGFFANLTFPDIAYGSGVWLVSYHTIGFSSTVYARGIGSDTEVPIASALTVATFSNTASPSSVCFLEDSSTFLVALWSLRNDWSAAPLFG